MILSDMEVELLAWCKPKIEHAHGHSYICIWLDYALQDKFQIEDLGDSQEALMIYHNLTAAISEALGNRTTVCMYLSSHVDGFLDLDSRQKIEMCRLARMAWIDKMIETRTIA
jgi:hypothetical protein